MYNLHGKRVRSRTAAVALTALALGITACSEAPMPVAPTSEARAAGYVDLAGVPSTSLLAQTNVPVGGTAQVVLSGSLVSWRRNVYRTRNAGVATVNSKGLVTGIANGVTYVTVTYNTTVDSSRVVVGTGATMTVSPSSVTLTIGSTQMLTIGGTTAAVTYSSADTSVAVVSAGGNIFAVGAGTTTIRASVAAGLAVTVPVTVPMAFSPPSLAITAGTSTPISLGTLSNGCRIGTRVYVSSNTGVATVANTGVITGVAAGTANIQVTAGSCTGTLPVTVSANNSNTPAPTAPVGSIAVALQRFSGAAGAVNYSTGFPLPPGALTASGLGNVRVYLNGIEQPIFVKALGGAHPDGSLRAILIQGNVVAPAAGQNIPGYVTLNSARTTATLSEVAPPSVLEAALLPTSATYLVSTDVGGKMLEASQLPALPSNILAQETDFEVMAPQLAAKYPNSWARDQSVYEHVLTHYQQWLSTGNAKWYQMAWGMAEAYRAYFAITTNYPTEWASTTEGLALHYLLSGDERARVAVGRFTEWYVGSTEYIYPFNVADGAIRFKARSMLASLDCLRIACDPGADKYRSPFTTPLNLKAILPTMITKMVGTQAANGMFPGTQYNGGQKNFMVGMQLWALSRYYDEFSADPVVLTIMKKSLDYTWTNEWDPAKLGFRYCSITFGDCNMVVQPSLNNLLTTAYVWYYARTKDGTYLSRADQLFAGNRTARPDWLGFVKQFDQAMYRKNNYYFLRQ